MPAATGAAPPPPTVAPAAPASTLYVDAAAGSDTSGTGSKAKPLQTLEFALYRSRQLRAAAAGDGERLAILCQGVFHLAAPLVLTPIDSNLTIAAVEGEHATLSGGLPLTPKWRPYNISSGANIWAADLSGDLAPGTEINGLQLGGSRVTRARYPNANPEIDTFPTGWVVLDKATTWQDAGNKECEGCTFDTASPRIAPLERGVYEQHMEGTGGPCSIFASKRSYWCSEHPSSACPSVPQACATCGNGQAACGSGHASCNGTGQKAAWFGPPPTGMHFGAAQLPHAPYKHGADGAIVQAWRHGHWFK